MRKLLLLICILLSFFLVPKLAFADCSNIPSRCGGYSQCTANTNYSNCQNLGGCHWNDNGSFCAYNEGATPAPVYNCTTNRDPACPTSTHDCIETQTETCNGPNRCLSIITGTATRYCAYPKGDIPTAPSACVQENQTSCSGSAGTQGNCCNGLICERNGGTTSSYITNGICKAAPPEFGDTCYHCPSGSTYNGTNCADSNGNFVNEISKGYCTEDVGLRCVQGQGCQFIETPTPTPTTLKLPCGNEDTKDCSRIQTALGPIDTDPALFVKWVLGFILSVSGGIVLLLIIASGYRLMTSQGDPEKVKEAKERLTAAIVGLLFIIFSLVILRAITVDIFHIPGFS